MSLLAVAAAVTTLSVAPADVPAASPPTAPLAAAATPERAADPPPAATPAALVAPAAPVAAVAPTRTKKPAFAAWKTAPEARLARTIPDCKAQQIAEWLRIRCDFEVSSASLLAGDARDVTLAPLDKNAAFSVVLALRPGDRRVIQLNHFFAFSKWGASEAGAAEISEMWLPGAAAPVVVVN
jgi:hypothetical protein